MTIVVSATGCICLWSVNSSAKGWRGPVKQSAEFFKLKHQWKCKIYSSKVLIYSSLLVFIFKLLISDIIYIYILIWYSYSLCYDSQQPSLCQVMFPHRLQNINQEGRQLVNLMSLWGTEPVRHMLNSDSDSTHKSNDTSCVTSSQTQRLVSVRWYLPSTARRWPAGSGGRLCRFLLWPSSRTAFASNQWSSGK